MFSAEHLISGNLINNIAHLGAYQFIMSMSFDGALQKLSICH